MSSLGPTTANTALRRIKVVLRENCLVGIPRHPASCSVSTSNLACRLINIVQSTLASASNDFGVAEGGVAIGPGRAVIAGHDPRSACDYVAEPYFGDNGGSASATVDGNLTNGAPVGARVAYRDSIELVEQRYRIVYRAFQLVQDSGAKTTGSSSRSTMTISRYR
jgi:N-methylhydantoinase B